MKTDNQENLLKDPDEDLLDLIKPKNFDVKNFSLQFKDKSEQVLHTLLKMQTNDKPLKKGGKQIAYRCDLLILANKQRFSATANTLLDIISGVISSKPEEEVYVITAEDIIKSLPGYNQRYIYELLQSGTEELRDKNFIFDTELKNGAKRSMAVPWFDILAYESKPGNYNELSYMSFKPTAFYKMLTVASTIVHGAHYKVDVASKIRSGYVRTLFYLLSSRKEYKEYPNAQEGYFEMSINELQDLLGFPSTYKVAIIKRDILEAGKKIINNIEECDFTFEYTLIKTRSEESKKLVTSQVAFQVTLKNESMTIAHTVTDKENIGMTLDKIKVDNKEVLINLLQELNLTDDEIKDILIRYINYKRDVIFMVNAIAKVSNSSKVKSKTGLLCYIMENGLKNRTKNDFNNYDQNEYDYEKLENLVLKN